MPSEGFDNQLKGRYARLQRLFDSALELDPGLREAFVTESCPDDPELRRQLSAMIRDADQASPDNMDIFSDSLLDCERDRLDALLDRGMPDRGSANPLEDLSPGQYLHTSGWASTTQLIEEAPIDGNLPTFGQYQLQRRIAAGGMGTVYVAQQESPKRKVAIKMIHTHLMTPSLVQRFQRESDILGMLQHPGIARVYEAGSIVMDDSETLDSLSSPGMRQGDTVPYFAMEFIDGVTLTKYCDQQGYDHRQRLNILADICDAVQYAHERGVIHRDLKPDNILVNEHGQPKILDFGIARVTDGECESAISMTQQGQVLGTLAYMAPEQMDSALDVSTRTDVYTLGVIGFEMLANRLPHELTGKTMAASLTWLLANDPPLLGSIARGFRGDIQTIIGTALERAPDRRYASPGALAEDIRRFLNNEPILARPPSRTYQASKFLRRHRMLASAVSVVLILLVGGITGTTFANMRTQKTLGELRRVTEYQGERLSLDPAMAGVNIHGDLVDTFKKSLESGGYAAPIVTEALSDFERSLDRISLTTYAAKTLEENILNRSLDTIDAAFTDQPVVRARLLTALACSYDHLGLWSRGHEIHRKAIAINRDVIGDEQQQTVSSIIEMARTDHISRLQEWDTDELRNIVLPFLEQRNQSSDAQLFDFQLRILDAEWVAREHEESGERAALIARIQATLGPDHELTIEREFAGGSGSQDDSLMVHTKQYEKSRRVLGEKHPLTLTLMLRVAVYAFRHDLYDDAERLYLELIQYYSDSKGGQHPETIKCMTSLATLMEVQDKLGESERYFRTALELDTQGAFRIRRNLGFLLYRQGKLDEAKDMLLEARELASSLHEALSVDTNLILVLADSREAQEAAVLGRQTLQTLLGASAYSRERLLGAVRAYLGRAVYQQGHYADAEAILLQAYDELAEGNQNKFRLARTAGFLADLYEDWHTDDANEDHRKLSLEWRAEAARIKAELMPKAGAVRSKAETGDQTNGR